jgi:hypothetical protein
MTTRPLGPIDPAGNVMADSATVSMARIARARHAVAADDRRHVGEHEQPVGVERDRQLGRGQVLNYRLVRFPSPALHTVRPGQG